MSISHLAIKSVTSQLEISGITVQVVRKPIKNLHLSVRPPDGQVRVSVPWQMSEENLRLAIISRLHWIQKHQAVFQAQPRQTVRQMVTGEIHPVFGQSYCLKLIERADRPQVILQNDTLQLFVKPGTSTEDRSQILTEWYREQLKAKIPDLLDYWQPKINQQVNDWGIKKMKTRWGSCNITDRRIWLNLELAKTSIDCLEYVLVHELVHLLERRHNDRFKAYMNHFLPHWKQCDEILKRESISS